MPIFNYECNKCSKIFEKIFFYNTPKDVKVSCPKCKATSKKIMSGGNHCFKVSGYSARDGYSDMGLAFDDGQPIK